MHTIIIIPIAVLCHCHLFLWVNTQRLSSSKNIPSPALIWSIYIHPNTAPLPSLSSHSVLHFLGWLNAIGTIRLLVVVKLKVTVVQYEPNFIACPS